MPKQRRAETIEIYLKLPSFKPRVELLRRVPRSATERRGNIRYCPRDSFTMFIPNQGSAVEDCPFPVVPIVRWIDVEFPSEQLDKQIGIIENSEMHDVHSE